MGNAGVGAGGGGCGRLGRGLLVGALEGRERGHTSMGLHPLTSAWLAAIHRLHGLCTPTAIISKPFHCHHRARHRGKKDVQGVGASPDAPSTAAHAGPAKTAPHPLRDVAGGRLHAHSHIRATGGHKVALSSDEGAGEGAGAAAARWLWGNNTTPTARGHQRRDG